MVDPKFFTIACYTCQSDVQSPHTMSKHELVGWRKHTTGENRSSGTHCCRHFYEPGVKVLARLLSKMPVHNLTPHEVAVIKVAHCLRRLSDCIQKIRLLDLLQAHCVDCKAAVNVAQ